jgi:hypothetical protein
MTTSPLLAWLATAGSKAARIETSKALFAPLPRERARWPPGGYLVAVTVYRKGAEVVRERLEADARTIPICSAGLPIC